MMNHVLLVSAQPMPNFLPILDAALKPDSVTLVVSDQMKDRAEWLKNEISKHQVKILDDIDIGDEATDIVAIQSRLIEWCDAHPQLMETSVLNVTGGTKPMAIAAQEVFRMAGRPVFYVDVATDKVSWIPGTTDSVTLAKSPTLAQVLGLNGMTLESGDFRSEVENEKWRHFCDEIAGAPEEWAACLGALNAIASSAVDEYKYARNSMDRRNALAFSYGARELANPKWNEMVEILHADELIHGETAAERFVSDAAAQFCAGIWLEHYVFSMLKKFKFDRKRALMNAKVIDAKKNRNEIDSIVIHGNTCYLIEDKTKNMDVKNGDRGNIADNAVYKLSQLTKSMGLRTKGILVSARAVRPVDKERARAYGVEIIDWLPDLEPRLKNILGL